MPESDDADVDLLERWRAGDESAGRALFERCYPSLFRFCANKAYSRTEVEDVIQETFLACIEGGARFRGEARFRTFLFAVARNILLKNARKRTHDSLDEGRLRRDESVVERMCRRQEERLLLRALRRLPIDLQIAVELAYWERLTTKEVAEFFDVPVGTMKSRLRKARTLLRTSIAELVDIPGGARSTTGNLDGWSDALRALLQTSSDGP